MTLDDLYTMKGKLITELEAAQTKLDQINCEIGKLVQEADKICKSNGNCHSCINGCTSDPDDSPL
jgi:hypothetical protein